MPDKLSDLFEAAQASTVTWQGQTVHSMIELRFLSGTALRIAFEDPNPARPQGLRLKAREGTLRVACQELDDLVFWSDSAPPLVEVQVVTDRSHVDIRFWNGWRDPREAVHAWIGNAGMLVEKSDSGFRLRCSDGFDEVTFDDLVASVEVFSP